MTKFENDVKMYGTETKSATYYTKIVFENDVKMYGTETQRKDNQRDISV